MQELHLPRILLPTGLVHETPLQTRREPRSTPSSQPALFNLVDDPGISLQEDLLGLVPISTALSSLDTMIVPRQEVGEDPILVFEASVTTDGGVGDGR